MLVLQGLIDRTDDKYCNKLNSRKPIYQMLAYRVRFFCAKQLYLQKTLVVLNLAVLFFVIFPGT